MYIFSRKCLLFHQNDQLKSWTLTFYSYKTDAAKEYNFGTISQNASCKRYLKWFAKTWNPDHDYNDLLSIPNVSFVFKVFNDEYDDNDDDAGSFFFDKYSFKLFLLQAVLH